jgi:hypothetical protein
MSWHINETLDTSIEVMYAWSMKTGVPIQEAKSRQKLAAENMSKVQLLNRALQSGPLKSELRTVSEAIHAARALYKQIEGAGIAPKDFHVHIAYLTPDLSVLSTQPFEIGYEPLIQTSLSGTTCSIMVGILFLIRDWERKNWAVGARAFLDTPLVRKAIENWVKEMRAINAD